MNWRDYMLIAEIAIIASVTLSMIGARMLSQRVVLVAGVFSVIGLIATGATFVSYYKIDAASTRVHPK